MFVEMRGNPQMKVYVINLAKNVERMEHMDAQLKRLGIEYERIDAIYGKELSAVERRRMYSSLRSRIALGVKMRDGEIGCALSHVKVYKRMLDMGIDKAVVFEDDIKIGDNLKEILDRIERFIDVGRRQVVALSAHGAVQRNENDIVPVDSFMCTDGYVITLAAAKAIIRANFPVVSVADSWFRWKRLIGLELYRAWPTTVSQMNDEFGTDIALSQHAFKGIAFVAFKLVRCFEKPMDWLLSRLTGR